MMSHTLILYLQNFKDFVEISLYCLQNFAVFLYAVADYEPNHLDNDKKLNFYIKI